MYTVNQELELAYKFIEFTGENIFLTGKAGTGKTTFLKHVVNSVPKRIIIVAPTGVAAMNSGGVTIHSFFQLPYGPFITGLNQEKQYEKSDNRTHVIHKFGKEKIKIIKSIDLLIIDEISMVRADLLDAVDAMLRRYRTTDKPFGGVQLLMIGDLMQLSPVVKNEEWSLLKDIYDSPYFFSSKALASTPYITIELNEIFRQNDPKFIELLNCIRDKKQVEHTICELNKRYITTDDDKKYENYIILTTHNHSARQINEHKLSALNGENKVFIAKVDGLFPEFLFPTDYELLIKQNEQVMFIKNDISAQKRYFNGKIGIVSKIGDDYVEVKCEDDDQPIKVYADTWQNTKYSIDSDSKNIIEVVEGSFKQIPLKAAWAITVHKSQGLTFDKVMIDAQSAFASGQLYVALSRCRSLEGILLISKINSNAIIDNFSVSMFLEDKCKNKPDENLFKLSKSNYFINLIEEMFDYDRMVFDLKTIYMFLNRNLASLYPNLLNICGQTFDNVKTQLQEVSWKFNTQINYFKNISIDIQSDSVFKDRIIKASDYFYNKTLEITCELIESLDIEIDNKELSKTYKELSFKIREAVELKIETLKTASEGFNIHDYLKIKSDILIGKKEKKTKNVSFANMENIHPDLLDKLKIWRKCEAEKMNVEPYLILHQKALKGIAEKLPVNKKELLSISGIGKKIFDKYGGEIISMVLDYYSEHKELYSPLSFTIHNPTPIKNENEDEVFEEKNDSNNLGENQKKEPSYISTYTMYKSGKSIKEIAKERNLTVSTIESHIISAAKDKLIDIYEFVEENKIEKIIEVIKQNNPESNLKEIRGILGENFKYFEIKLVRALYNI